MKSSQLGKVFAIQGFCRIKSFLKTSHARKRIQFSEVEVAANFDMWKIIIKYAERFTGCVCNLSILSHNWASQNSDFLASIERFYATLPNTCIAKFLTRTFPDL